MELGKTLHSVYKIRYNMVTAVKYRKWLLNSEIEDYIKEQELWGGKFWSDGKYIGTVGEATSEKTIRKYIRN